jgi:hypothetical protein
MITLDSLYQTAKQRYDAGLYSLDCIENVVCYCLLKLGHEATQVPLVDVSGKSYRTMSANLGLSRPYVEALLITDPDDFQEEWAALCSALCPADNRINLDAGRVNSAIYTAVMAFAMTYDLWKRSSRKTPGTFFEVVLGSLMGPLLPNHSRTKQIPIPGTDQRVSTDIVFATPVASEPNLVIPAKITTRERIVQPFAHQRILDSVFGLGRYLSLLACVSEMQLDRGTSAHEVCVPGTVRLFQEHLAAVGGIFYLDPPGRYLASDITSVVTVSTIGSLLTKRLAEII